MNSSAMDIKDYLVGQIQTLFFGQNLFIGNMPETDDLCVVIYDTPGVAQDDPDIGEPSIQVLTRGVEGGYIEAYSLAKTIEDTIHNKGNFTLNGTFYMGIWKLSEVFHVGNDKQSRPLFSCNFRIMRRS